MAYNLLDEGYYTATVKGREIVTTKTGKLMVNITLDIEGEGLIYRGLLEGKGLKFTLDALLACGLKGDNPAGEIEVGKKVSATIEQEDYNDKTYNKVAWINPLGQTGGKKKETVPQDLALAKLADLQIEVVKARAAQKADAPASLDDSETIPF